MKKLFSALFLLFFTVNSFAYSSKVSAAYAIGIFDAQGKGENIQHVRETKHDYNGTVFSKIVVFGNFYDNYPKIKIGESIGHFIKTTPIYNKKKIKIAQELTYKHYNVTKGYFEVKYRNKVYDTKVFVK